MGADTFFARNAGKDARDAFSNAVEDARYRHGHEGYTGTIAEKSGFHLVDLKALGMTRARFDKAMAAADAYLFADADMFEYQRANKATVRKAETARKRARAKLERIAGNNTSAILSLAKQYDDKWGPALCVEVTGKAAREWKAQRGLARKRVRVFDFFGWASC